MLLSGNCRLAAHLKTKRGLKLTERHVVFDISRLFLGARIVPGSVLDGVAVDGDVVIAGVSLPWTVTVSVGSGQDRLVHGLRREIDVAFDSLVFVGAGYDGAGDFGGRGGHN